MRIEGTTHFPATPEQVWAAFTDPEVLRRATPGCETLTAVAPDQYEATLKVGVAGITGTYKGQIRIEEKDPPRHFRLVVAGQGTPGYVQGTATFDFTPQDGGTHLAYAWDVQVGGLVAGVGQRVLTGVAKMLIQQFFAAIGRALTAP